MGAHNAATLAAARDRIIAVRDSVREASGATADWAGILDRALIATPGGTIKAWMQAHHDDEIQTFQTTIKVAHFGQAIIEPIDDWWIPGARRVDAARATRVLLDGSEREYAGVTTFIATEDLYVGFGKWGDDRVQLIVYSA